ncbi:MAG TPA: TIM barrel protein [Chryseolinea sp.]|nr:TIM barrel protein [Chryseolinea sp.]
MKTNRREFILNSLLLSAGVSASSYTPVKAFPASHRNAAPLQDNDIFKISIFSKHLQWLNYAEMAQVAAQIGFDGVDITVRPGGHVLPERVAEDLPKAVDAVRKAGMNVYMITTAVTDADDPFTDSILKTASALGIRHYRTGWLKYNSQKNIEDNLKDFELQLSKLAAINKKYSIQGEYQNHSGEYFGAPIWDLYTVLKGINSPWLASQYDIFHATIEGANSWPIGLKLIKPYIRSIDIKDFQWAKKDGKWMAEVVPLGEGLVDYKSYLNSIKLYGINVPISMHFEYSLGGAEHGNASLTIDRRDVIKSMQTDLNALKVMMRTSRLVK